MRGNLEVFIPMVALVVIWAIAFVALYFRNRSRHLRHAERMAAIEKGIDLPPEPGLGRNAYLLRGLIWLTVGIGTVIFFLALYFAERDRDELPVATLGLIPIGVGIAYLVVYRIEGRQSS